MKQTTSVPYLHRSSTPFQGSAISLIALGQTASQPLTREKL